MNRKSGADFCEREQVSPGDFFSVKLIQAIKQSGIIKKF